MSETLLQIPYSWVEKLFHNMQMTYGNRMETMWGGQDVGQVMYFWHMKIDGMEITREEFTRGVKALDRQDYPPTLPQFIKLCRPDINPMSAYYEAVKGLQARRNGDRGIWSHPAIFWAAAEMAHDLLNMSQHQVENRWKDALSSQLEKTRWNEIPEVHAPLPAPVSTISKEEASRRLQQLGATDFSSPIDDSWIIRGLKRMKDGWNPPQGVKDCYRAAAKAKGIAL